MFRKYHLFFPKNVFANYQMIYFRYTSESAIYQMIYAHFIGLCVLYKMIYSRYTSAATIYQMIYAHLTDLCVLYK